MDYLEIVLRGCCDENNRGFLNRYFYREFKKAEKEQFFEADEFFTGCMNVIEKWEQYIKEQKNERKVELYRMLDGAKDGTMKYGDLGGKTIEQVREESIEYCENELQKIDTMPYSAHLNYLTDGRVSGHLQHDELLGIKQEIILARKKADPQKEKEGNNLIGSEYNRTTQVILEVFEQMDDKSWKYAFLSEQNFNSFCDILTNFFEFKEYSLPNTVIQLKRGCKTKLAKALGDIHKELSNENKLVSDEKFFSIIRILSHFQNEKQNDLYKALTR